MTMDEAASKIPNPSFLEALTHFGPIGVFGWFSLLFVIIMGCILLMVPPRSGRRISLVDVFAACLHIQMLIFILCVPLPLVGAAYLTLSARPYVIDSFVAPASVILNFTISGALLVAVALRHRTPPTIEWLPAVSLLASIISLFAVWQLTMAAFIPFT